MDHSHIGCGQHITANGMGKSACITLASHVLILTWVCTYFNLQTYKIYTSSRGPGLDLYAHNLGEDNSTVIG